MKTKKKRIFDALKTVTPSVYYMDTFNFQLPRVNFGLIYHGSRRYSNKRHSQQLVYQVDYFSKRALEAESDPILWGIIEVLEAEGFLTTDWIETLDVDEKANRSIWHYWIEVR